MRNFVLKILLLFLFLKSTSMAAEFDYRGFIDTYHSVRTEGENDFLSSRTRVRFEGQLSEGDGLAYISLNAVQNEIVESETGFNLREAFVEYSFGNFDFRAGKQIIIWGKADGFYVTDIISPKDYSESFARDFDDMRIPVDAVKGRFISDSVSAELIFIPSFTPAVIPGVTDDEENPWTVSSYTSMDINDPELPEEELGNSETAIKISFYSSFLDFSLIGFHGWDDNPYLDYDGSSYTPRYNRISVLGFEFSIPFSEVILRGEVSVTYDKLVATESSYVEKNVVKSLLGLDWSPGNNWSVSLQLYDSYIDEYEQTLSEEKHNSYVSIYITKKLLRETLTLSTMHFYGLTNEDHYNRTYLDYALNDQIHTILGTDWFHGETGMFGVYQGNSQVFTKIKYSF